MSSPCSARRVVVAILILLFSIELHAQASAARGAGLFEGTIPFRAGGPACGACHTAAGVSFPNGGTLGPDLTTAYARYGPDAMQTIIASLFFPTMMPVFQNRLLTPAEQADLLAFFAESSKAAGPPNVAPAIDIASIVVALILFALTALLWRRRTVGVRHALVARATGDRQS